MDNDKFDNIWKLLKGPNAALSVLYAKNCVKRAPQDGVAWFMLGKVLIEGARYKEALAALEKDEKDYSRSCRYQIYSELGNLYKKAGQFSKAARWYRRAARLA